MSGSLGSRPESPSRRSASAVAGRAPAGSHGGSHSAIAPRDRHHSAPRVHPRDRGFVEHAHIGSFYHHHHPHYYGWRVHALPPHYHHHRYWGWDYYYHSGIYYRWYDGFYYVCRPPFGVYFDRVLYDLDLVLIDFAYYNTVSRTYNAINDNYRTIEEQNRVIAENNALIASQNAAMAGRSAALADESYQLAASLGLVQSYADANVKYYYDDGVFFIEGKDGQYQTIVPPAGAIITELPDDYEVVVLGGKEYYRVDNTIYRMVAIDGKAYFEVLGQQVN